MAPPGERGTQQRIFSDKVALENRNVAHSFSTSDRTNDL